ncbi:Cit [Symbiodinium natans]|uniref:Cit protein n=1 Tax=Symbiodinium natans TaxID=878477 RepID=A0A812PNA6_9DINO|nr:Cit [Symbiodinium natans]
MRMKSKVYVAMEKCLGDLAQTRVEDEVQLWNYAGQLLQAVCHLHTLGYLHRDIKPENVLRVEGKLKLADFGCRCRSTSTCADMALALEVATYFADLATTECSTLWVRWLRAGVEDAEETSEKQEEEVEECQPQLREPVLLGQSVRGGERRKEDMLQEKPELPGPDVCHLW